MIEFTTFHPNGVSSTVRACANDKVREFLKQRRDKDIYHREWRNFKRANNLKEIGAWSIS